jgi:hypothetical protein
VATRSNKIALSLPTGPTGPAGRDAAASKAQRPGLPTSVAVSFFSPHDRGALVPILPGRYRARRSCQAPTRPQKKTGSRTCRPETSLGPLAKATKKHRPVSFPESDPQHFPSGLNPLPLPGIIPQKPKKSNSPPDSMLPRSPYESRSGASRFPVIPLYEQVPVKSEAVRKRIASSHLFGEVVHVRREKVHCVVVHRY